MRVTVKLPRVADTVDEVTIIEWARAVGDEIAEGDALVRVETDKTTVEIPAPVSGQVAELLAEVDEDVVTGAPIAIIET